MNIPEDLKKLLRDGDLKYIADMYKERHEAIGDYKTVSPEYVRQIIHDIRPANPETAGGEIARIAIAYLEHRRNFTDEMLIV